jgi:hypothetical protein
MRRGHASTFGKTGIFEHTHRPFQKIVGLQNNLRIVFTVFGPRPFLLRCRNAVTLLCRGFWISKIGLPFLLSLPGLTGVPTMLSDAR